MGKFKMLLLIIPAAVTIWLFGVVLIGAIYEKALELVVHKVLLPWTISPVFTDYWDSGSVHASGTWALDNENDDHDELPLDWIPLQASEIRCNKNEGLCTEASAKLEEWLGLRLSVELKSYAISRWDNQFLTYQESARCWDWNYTIDRVNQTVTAIHQRKQSEGESCAYGKEKVNLTLRDGLAISVKRNVEPRRQLFPVLVTILVLWSTLVAWKAVRMFKAATKKAIQPLI